MNRHGCNGFAQSLGKYSRALDIGARKNNAKLFATVTASDIHFAQLCPQGAADFANNIVADGMTVGIVYLFEVVDIEHD